MSTVASRDLRNHTADVLRRVAEGETVTVTVRGQPVAQMVPLGDRRPRFFTRDELVNALESVQADPGLREDLKWISRDRTDDLDPLW